MSLRFWIRLAEIAIVLLLAAIAFTAWRADRHDRAQLASELAATKQQLIAADTRQHDRDAQLEQTLAGIAAEKRAITAPVQIVRELPREIPLPVPIELQRAPATNHSTNASAMNQGTAATGGIAPPENETGKPSRDTLTNAPQPNAVIPAADLKPLYDFALDCKACQAKLAAIEADLNDEKAKTAAMTRERNDALKVARGGSFLRRAGRAAKWFLIGAAAGAVAAKAAH